MAVEADDLREHLAREHRHAAGLFLEDDLQQDAAREVIARLRVAHHEVVAREHHLLHVGERDVAAGLGVVEPPVGVLLEDARACARGARAVGRSLGRRGAAVLNHRVLLGPVVQVQNDSRSRPRGPAEG